MSDDKIQLPIAIQVAHGHRRWLFVRLQYDAWAEGSVTVPQEHGDRSVQKSIPVLQGDVIHDNKVKLAILVQIDDRERYGFSSYLHICLRPERGVPISEEDGYRVVVVVGNDEIRLAIAVQIANRDISARTDGGKREEW